MRKISRRGSAGVLAGMAALAIAGSAVAGSSAPAPQGGQPEHVARPSDAIQGALAAFGRPAGPGNVVPAGVRGALAGSRGVADVNPDLARAVGPGGRLHLMPGAGQLCVGRDLDPGSVVYCAEETALVEGRFVGAVVHTPAGLEVGGIVGDGASAARVTTTRGTVDVAVVGGAVLTTVDAPPVSISWVDRDGQRRTQAIEVVR